MAEKREPTLAEIVSAGKGGKGRADPLGNREALIADLRRARRFVLDDDATRVISRARGEFKSTPVLQYARSPFEGVPVWIEYGHWARLEALDIKPYGDASKLSGFMIYDRDDGYVKAQPVWCFDGEAIILPFWLLHRYDGGVVEVAERFRRDDEDRVHRCRLAGIWHAGDGAIPVSVAMSIGFDTTPEAVRAGEGKPDWDGNKGHVVLNLLPQCYGDVAFLATALALINRGLIRSVERPRPPGQRMLNGKLRPYMSDSVISVAIPARMTVAEALKRAHREEQARKRAHEVRGHFRHYSDGRVVWIKSHQRGDASLGFVRQKYEVHAAKG